MFLYGGQRLAEGVAPYLGIFDVKGPISPMVAGLGVLISKWLGWDDVYTVRLVYLVASGLTVVATYLFAKSLFESQRVGVFAALTFLGFFDFAREAASGPRAKTLVALFGVLSMFLTSRKRWFWAGLFGALSALTWQPAGIFLLATLIIAAAQPRKERFLAVSSSLLGIGTPAAALVLYFFSQNALQNLLDGILLFHFRYRDMPPMPLILHAWLPLRAIFDSFRMMTIPIMIGSAMVLYFYIWRRSFHTSLRDTLTKDDFSPLLLTLPPFLAWSALDFQDACDFYVFIPYITIGFGRFLDMAVSGIESHFGEDGRKWAPRGATVLICAALIGSATLDIRFGRDFEYLEQRNAAIRIERLYGEDIKLAAIGAPEVLVILRRANPNPYIVITVGMDHMIHAKTLGGFRGWLAELAAYDPDVIAFGPTHGMHLEKLMTWLNARYYEKQIGPWKLYVKKSLRN